MMTQKNIWIFTPLNDMVLLLAGPLCFLLMTTQYSPPLAIALCVWFSLVIFDSGHVYLSYLRTYKEFTTLRKKFYFVHIGFFITFFLIQWLKIPYLWHLVVYATFFHFLRQFFGIYRRYLLKNDKFEKREQTYLDIFFYGLTTLPTLCFHFREDFGEFGYYAKVDLFRFPNQNIFVILLFLYYLILLLWVCFEYYQIKKRNRLNIPRLCYFSFTFLLFNLIFLFSKTKMQIIAPLVLTHGLQYYYFIGDNLKTKHNFCLKKIFILFMFSGVLTGILSSIWEEQYSLDYSYLSNTELGSTLSISLLLTLLFFHYFIDAVIWRRAYLSKQNSQNT